MAARKKPLKSVPRIWLKQVRDGRVRFAVEKVGRPQEVYEAIRRYYRGLDREMLSVLCLDGQNQPTCFHVCSVGGLNTTRTRPADIVKAALLSNALGLILVHNHPSGSLDPSKDDVEFTRSVSQACEMLGLELFDHLIVGDDSYVSLKERGLL